MLPTNTHITARELFGRVSDILETMPEPSQSSNRMMHETLVLACNAGLRNTSYSFGNLSSQVDVLCNMHHLKTKETIAIQRMRRDSNSGSPLSAEQLHQDCRALALFISAIFDESIPETLTSRLPHFVLEKQKHSAPYLKRVRCTVRSWQNGIGKVHVDQDNVAEIATVDCKNTPEYIDYSYLNDIVSEGTQLNLLDCEIDDNIIKPRYVIVEPDYLLDISTLAACFEDYGHHPLQYVVRQLKKRPNTVHTLLGNLAGTILDDAVNGNADIGASLRRDFKEKALEYVTCSDFDAGQFKQKAIQQAQNIEQIVNELFSTYDRNTALLEPSFVCEQLGLNGRVDMMTTDMRLLIEQKSGRNIYIERNERNRHGSLHIEKHYVQLLLYYGILQRNFGVKNKNADIRLLYSKYPLPDGLVRVEALDKLFREALKLRNCIVAQQYSIVINGFESIVDDITPHTLNTEKLNDSFYQRYQLPELLQTTDVLQRMSDLERAYYCEMMTFVIREQLLHKVGNSDLHGGSTADLWNMPLSEKLETGNIFTGLIIINKEKSSEHGGYDIITLQRTDSNVDFLPNFRRGDMVYLYALNADEAPDVTRSILYKGVIAELGTNEVCIKLNNAQQNETILPPSTLLVPPSSLLPPPSTIHYTLEHADSDIGTLSAMKGLHELMTCNKERRDLLLSQRAPRSRKGIELSRNYHENYDEIVLKAMQARDYFLLIGPPGTGKTSMALRYIVQEELSLSSLLSPLSTLHSPLSSLLITAYTNRAVDEICGMLVDAGIDFIRIGNEFSCDPQYRQFLLNKIVDSNCKLSALRLKLSATRVIVSTTTTLQSKPYIFDVKHFSLAIVDEASQILEPSLMGLLCKDSIDRFILIGDYKQLPAVVQQKEHESAVDNPLLHAICLDNCRNSLFERLVRVEHKAGRKDFIGVLRRQGRMHPDVAKFANEHFYHDEDILPVPLSHQREKSFPYTSTPQDDFDKQLMTHRMLFIPSEMNHVAGQSDKVNEAEGHIVANLLQRIRRYYGDSFDARKTVGVIVPYRNQIAMVRKALAEKGVTGMEEISIDTVERYQGSQRDIIIYDFTVQHRYQLDFLTANRFVDNGTLIDRKLNVALTRSRMQTILIGNEKVLRNDPLFRDLLDSMVRLSPAHDS